MPSEKTWQQWLERLYNLRRDKGGTHERPHKAILLIAILDLFDRGILCHNQVAFNPELLKTFERYLDVVRRDDDSSAMDDPFCRLADDGFWQVLGKSGNRLVYEPGTTSRPLSPRILRESYGRFDDGLWFSIITYAQCRRQLRDALISRYFPAHRDELDLLVGRQNPLPSEIRDEAPGREAAFRHTILGIYDHRCAACGIRLQINDQLSLVVATHLIPFKLSRNDRPDNGLALCPNHHWAMESFLLAPCPDSASKAGVWRVRDDLDTNLEGHGDLAALANRPVGVPNEEKFLPAREALKWREEHLNREGLGA